MWLLIFRLQCLDKGPKNNEKISQKGKNKKAFESLYWQFDTCKKWLIPSIKIILK